MIKFGLYCNSSGSLYCVINGGSAISTGLSLTMNTWQSVSVGYDSSGFYVRVGTATAYTNTTVLNLTDSITYIGSLPSGTSSQYHFEGKMEMFAFSDSKVADSIITGIVDNGGRIIVRSRYDDFSRPKYKDIIVGANTINTTEYQYKELANGNTTPRIEKESYNSILSGKDETIEYTYDNAGNITSKITKNESNVVIDTKSYQYDVMGRLTYESRPNMPKIHPDIYQVGEVYYTYDSNGNMTYEEGLQNNGDLSYTVSYTYHATVKDRLVSRELNIYNDRASLIATIIYTYTMNSAYTGNLASIYDGSTSTNLTWSGRRLTGIGSSAYTYDESGLRIGKSKTGDTSSFVYAGDRLIKQSRTINSVTTDTFFNYDENGLLMGLSINNKEYFYLRDITGNINKVIDIAGNVMVNYTYNAWGVVSRSVNSSLTGDLLTAANGLLVHNPYVYKGYYYDSDTGYYYLKSRYYDPRIHRFLSADKIDYLDPKSLSSLNLYVYCRDNPVMGYDPSGTVVLTTFLIGMGIAALIGAGVGAAAYAVNEVISYAITGEWNWSWAVFGGAILGGAMGGALAFALPGLGIAGSAFVTGAFSQGIGMGFQNAFEGANYSFLSIMESSLLMGGVSALTAGLTSKIRIPGFTGRGSISQVARQISTKFYNGSIGRITARTFSKMVAYEAAYSIFNVVAEVFVNSYNHYSRTPTCGYAY